MPPTGAKRPRLPQRSSGMIAGCQAAWPGARRPSRPGPATQTATNPRPGPRRPTTRLPSRSHRARARGGDRGGPATEPERTLSRFRGELRGSGACRPWRVDAGSGGRGRRGASGRSAGSGRHRGGDPGPAFPGWRPSRAVPSWRSSWCYGTGPVGAHLVDQQVRVGRGGPAGAPVVEPLEQDLAGQVIERAGPAADDDPPVAQVDVIEADLADRLDAGSVHRGEDQDQPGGGSGGGLRRPGKPTR